jgi:DNA polymerase-1
VGEARAVTAEYLPHLKGWLEDAGAAKVACDVKSALLALGRLGIDARGFEHDVMLYAFLLDADPSGCSLEEQARRRLDVQLGPSPEQHADITLELWKQLAPAVEARGMGKLYAEIELPLAPVLARMERTGVRIDTHELRRLSELMEGQIARLTAQIHGMAGRTFNIGSPQQLGEVLFDDLKLPAPVKYGKGKTRSTAADVLEELAADHEIVRQVLEYRQLTKLKGTYVDALPALIDPRTGRLHTSFNQTGAATGRLSSSNPNLQNIPIRTELGREIRAAFVPREGWKLLVADYSQIELRLLAHMSGDALLVEAFRDGEDIHTRTASEVLGVPPLMVTPEARRDAKAVNFGIVYGISAFGLAAQLGISRGEAEKYIKNYFARYAGVRRFIDATIAEVRQTGVTRTLFGRERPIPEINSRNASRARVRGADGGELAAARHGGGSDQTGDGAHRRRARWRRIPERDAGAGSRRTGVRVPAGGGGGGLETGEAGDGRGLPTERAAGGGCGGGGQLAGREVGLWYPHVNPRQGQMGFPRVAGCCLAEWSFWGL